MWDKNYPNKNISWIASKSVENYIMSKESSFKMYIIWNWELVVLGVVWDASKHELILIFITFENCLMWKKNWVSIIFTIL